MKKEKIIQLVLIITMLMSFSCKKFVTVEPEGAVRVENSFKNSTDAITVIQGLYGLMQPLVDQIFLASEAQGDLIVAARGADKYIREIAENRITPSNPYTDYTKFYRLVIACNQALKGFAEIAKIDPVYSKDIYGYNVAEVIYIRSWTYLQLVKIWGNVPYIEEGVIPADQIKDMTPMSSDLIINKIVAECQANFDKMQFLTVDGFNVNDKILANGQFNNVSSRVLLTELYVYAGNYPKAWATINIYAQGSANSGDASPYNMFAGQWERWDIAFNRRDVNQYIKMAMLTINFDGGRNQYNSLIKWTGNKNGAIYALRPSPNAINNWKTAPAILQLYQTTNRGFYFDETYTFGNGPQDVLNPDGTPVIGGYGDFIRGERGSYIVDGQDTLIFKYLNKLRGVEKSITINDRYSDNDAFFTVYRDGTLCLLMAEILNNMGLPNQALVTFNGIANYAYVMKGTRYRVGIGPLLIDPAGGDQVKQVDKLILQESAMETGFEGTRWFDLVRFAKRSPDPDFLGNIIAKKYPANMQAAIKNRLRNPANWYFPVYTGNTKAN